MSVTAGNQEREVRPQEGSSKILRLGESQRLRLIKAGPLERSAVPAVRDVVPNELRLDKRATRVASSVHDAVSVAAPGETGLLHHS